MAWYGPETDFVQCMHCGEVFHRDELIYEEGIHAAPMYMCTEDEYRCPFCGSYDIEYDVPDPDEEEQDDEEEEE